MLRSARRLSVAAILAAAALAPAAAVEAGPARPIRVAQASPPPKRSTVATVLQKGRDMYEDQRYEESIQTLSGVVVRSDASREERLEAYKLLAFNNIALGKNEEADAFVRALFVVEEGFELPKTESPKFRDFFEKAKKAWEADGKPGKAQEGQTAPEKKAVALKHAGLAQVDKGKPIKIEGTVDDPSVAVEKIELFYRAGAKGKFTEKLLAYSMGSFRGEIPASVVKPPLVEYYMLAIDKAGVPLASRGDADTPLRIVVPDAGKSVVESPWFWIPIGAVVVTGVVLGAVLGTQLGGSESTVKIKVTE